MQKVYVDECHHFRKPECKYINDELMKKYIHCISVEKRMDRDLYEQVNEYRCGICKKFKLAY